jgi:hypothetical protein
MGKPGLVLAHLILKNTSAGGLLMVIGIFGPTSITIDTLYFTGII